jgi:hypothetical protein
LRLELIETPSKGWGSDDEPGHGASKHDCPAGQDDMASTEQNYCRNDKDDDKKLHLPNQEVKKVRASMASHHFWMSSTRRAIQESW